jgi:GNAT superfamily N-acetyltransferase
VLSAGRNPRDASVPASIMDLHTANTPAEIDAARTLFKEYAAALGIDLAYQGFAEELANLPGAYAPPAGRLLIAWVDRTAAGCVALRPMSHEICEMKRLFVRPAYRGCGLGRRLAEAIIREAKQIGYVTMRLDTIPSLDTATHLYESLGFIRRDAYYDTPVAETIFMERVL